MNSYGHVGSIEGAREVSPNFGNSLSIAEYVSVLGAQMNDELSSSIFYTLDLLNRHPSALSADCVSLRFIWWEYPQVHAHSEVAPFV